LQKFRKSTRVETRVKLQIETSEDEDIKLRDPTIDTPILVSAFEEMTIKQN